MPTAAHMRRLAALETRGKRVEVDKEELARVVALMRATMPDRPEDEERGREAARQLPIRWQQPLPDSTNPLGGLRFHPGQSAARKSVARHRLIEAGRRSGKSEDRKREIVIRALDPTWEQPDRFIVVGAPTQDQTEDLYFDDLLALIPPKYIRRVRRSSPAVIELLTGAQIKLAGMDRPQRSEGKIIDDLFLDEYADMKADVWDDHLAPSLDTAGRRPGTVTLYGTPDLRAGLHFVDLCDKARERMLAGDPDWAYFHWDSRGIISDAIWKQRKSSMDPASFAVEYEARRVATGNRCYYTFDRSTHVVRGLGLIPDRPVILAFDWNWDPGNALIIQEQVPEDYEDSDVRLPGNVGSGFTAVIDEVFIRRSNTPDVCRTVAAVLDELHHRSKVLVYGDAMGGGSGSAKPDGSDLVLVRKVLGPLLGDRLFLRFERSNPEQKERVNAMNSRLLADDTIRMLVDSRCRELIRDLEQVQWKEGASHQINKPNDKVGKLRTHLSDGLGYYIAAVFPIEGNTFVEEIW